jgi:hypothetical protein
MSKLKDQIVLETKTLGRPIFLGRKYNEAERWNGEIIICFGNVLGKN